VIRKPALGVVPKSRESSPDEKSGDIPIYHPKAGVDDLPIAIGIGERPKNIFFYKNQLFSTLQFGFFEEILLSKKKPHHTEFLIY
jgi:hypothetical protein